MPVRTNLSFIGPALLGGIRIRNRSKLPAWREAACGDPGWAATAIHDSQLAAAPH
jgi:hypothetical protein